MSKMPPPTEFASLGLYGEFSGFRNGREWHGPCPWCQGNDRFVIHTEKPFPDWNWWCRVCGKKGWAHDLNPAFRQALDPERLKFLHEAEAARKQAQAETREKAIQKFTTQELWEELHRRLHKEHYAWWEREGIPYLWVDFWKMGYTAEKSFEFDGQFLTRAAYTIPKFDYAWKPVNIDFRLIDPPAGAGKYRGLSDLPPAPFISRPDLHGLTDEVFIVEGSKKAAVLAVHYDKEKQMLGVPSCNSWAGVEDRVKDCGRVWIIFDPDAPSWAEKLAIEIGANARLVQLPVKPDDAFIKYGMTAPTFESYLRAARRVS